MTRHRQPSGGTIVTERLRLEPLLVDHAVEMVSVLGDAALYEFTGGAPPTLGELEQRYVSQVAGPPDGSATWRNWIVRLTACGDAIGYVQATIVDDGADVAWLIGTAHQGRGYASEAARAIVEQLVDGGVRQISAHVDPAHHASQAVAARIGLSPTDEADEDGEVIWRSSAVVADTVE